jgi:hypothetical protein
MTNFNTDDQQSKLDQATSSRLSKLRTMPVDTSRLDREIRAQIPRFEANKPSPWIWLRSVRAIAASILILATIATILLTSSSGPVMASALQMAQVHEDMVAGRLQATRVNSIGEANQALATQWPQAPLVPTIPQDGTQTTPPTAQVMACCMHSVKNKKMVCVLLNNGNVPVTMTVANAVDMQMPSSPTMTRNGITYHVQAVDKLNMVMTEKSGRWVCLIGELSADQLMDLAAKLQF